MHDELYQVALADFTSTRDALAARLKAAGDAKGAAQVKGARKPSVAAWAVNQVVWRAAGDWERLRSATEAMRHEHQKGATADELRRAAGEQRDALQACEARATEQLVEHGHAAAPGVLTKVQHTLLALAHGVSGVTPGRLDHELPPPGFEALSGLSMAAPEAPGEPDGKERGQRRKALGAAEARAADTGRALQRSRDRSSSDEERVAKLERQVEEARAALEASRRQLEAAEKEHAAAEAALQARRAEAAED